MHKLLAIGCGQTVYSLGNCSVQAVVGRPQATNIQAVGFSFSRTSPVLSDSKTGLSRVFIPNKNTVFNRGLNTLFTQFPQALLSLTLVKNI